MNLGRTAGTLLSLVMAACSTNLSATSSPATVTATSLPSTTASADLATPTPVPGDSLLPLPPLSEARFEHSATLLEDGRVLVAGGRFISFDADHNVTARTLSSVEVFDPVTDTWSAGPALHQGRSQHTAIRLADGRVLVLGGRTEDGQIIGTAEVFDPETNAWTLAKDVPLDVATAIRLADERVLVIGYGADPNSLTPTAAVLDPSDGSWGPVRPIKGMSLSPVVALLGDGRVLAVGGFRADFGDGPPDPRAETALYDPSTDTWSAATAMNEPRLEPPIASLADGRVLVVSNASTEVFDPSTSTWTLSGAPLSLRETTWLVVLPDGRVLAIGDSAGSIDSKPIIEQYAEATGTWTIAAPFRVIEGLTATLLGDGRVLITGGLLECRFGQSCTSEVVLPDVEAFVPG
jgi:hypothetical protein